MSLLIALAQTQSHADLDKNLNMAEKLMLQARDTGAELIIFPECILSWGTRQNTHAHAKSTQQWLDILAPLSQEYQIAAIWGGIPEQFGEQVFNTSLAIDEHGALLCEYRKIHLFQMDAQGKDESIDESLTYGYGELECKSFHYQGYELGLSICYDLRFPEFYRQFSHCDAVINTAAFTRHTGRAHWEILLRARAIENQQFIIGVNQTGHNQDTGLSAYGHSMIVDPWGKVLCSAKDEPELLFGEINKAEVAKIRQKIPALKNKRF